MSGKIITITVETEVTLYWDTGFGKWVVSDIEEFPLVLGELVEDEEDIIQTA